MVAAGAGVGGGEERAAGEGRDHRVVVATDVEGLFDAVQAPGGKGRGLQLGVEVAEPRWRVDYLPPRSR